MLSKGLTSNSALLILPLLIVVFYALGVLLYDHAVTAWLPQWHTLSVLFTMIVLERLYRYPYAVSQRPVLVRDISSTLVNLFVTNTKAGIIFVPILALFPEFFFGRNLLFASSEQLGPIWLQIPMTLVVFTLFRYWMHRLQHRVPFLWELHSYHHRVTDIKASNTLVSHPIDFALRNVLPFFVVGVIGFHPLAVLIGVTATLVTGTLSHCGGDIKGGFLNYIFVTPEVHRWHHSANIPSGHRYAVNYGVGFIVWDLVFGTFYLPRKADHPEQPKRLGHPEGLADEKNYLKLLLAPLGLYPPFRLLKRA